MKIIVPLYLFVPTFFMKNAWHCFLCAFRCESWLFRFITASCFSIEINCVLHTEASNIGSSYYHILTLFASMCVNIEIAIKAFAKSDI